MNIFSQVIGQVLRYLLTALAVYLGVVGVTENQQGELVETIINWAVPIIIAGAVQVWAYYRKKYAAYLVETALLSPAGTSLEAIQADAKEAVKADSTALAKIALPSILIWCLVLTSTACPSKASLEKAQKESAKVARYANTGVELTRELFRSNFLSLAQKDKIADGFISLAKAGQAFDAAVANAIAQYGVDGAPPEVINGLFNTFNTEVVAQLVAVLASLKLTNVSGNFAAIIDTLKAAILVVAAFFKKKAEVQAQLA